MKTLVFLSLCLLALTVWIVSDDVSFVDPPIVKVERPIVVPCGSGGGMGTADMVR